jgi:hypothetical protein
MTHEDDRKEVSLPVRPFLYTHEQVAQILGMTENGLSNHVAFYEGASVHKYTPHDLKFINVGKPDDKKIWRCEERELVRWMKLKGVKVRDASWARR